MVEVRWHMRNAWLLQTSSQACQGGPNDPCRLESLHALFLLVGLCLTIVTIICAFAFFREDKEEQIKPLCPQLVVKDENLHFSMPADPQDDTFMVLDIEGQPVCKVAIDWPDPFRPGASGVAATVRLLNNLDLTLTTLVARNVAVVGQSLVLCRENGEMFASVEPDGPRRFHVRHRTNVHLLTLIGDFDNWNVEGINPVGSKVCCFQKFGTECRGWVLPHVDAGLAISSMLATHVHRRIAQSPPPVHPAWAAPFQDRHAHSQPPPQTQQQLPQAQARTQTQEPPAVRLDADDDLEEIEEARQRRQQPTVEVPVPPPVFVGSPTQMEAPRTPRHFNLDSSGAAPEVEVPVVAAPGSQPTLHAAAPPAGAPGVVAEP